MGDVQARGGGLGFIPWLLGSLLTTFAIVKLVQYGIVEHDFVAPLQAIVDAYEKGVEFLFREIGFEAAARWIAQSVAGLFHIDITLYDHWRHVFLLSMVLFLAFARVWGGRGAISVAALTFLFGLAGSLAGALIAGNTPLGGDARSEAVIFTAPYFALCVAVVLAGAATAFVDGRRGSGARALALALGISALAAFSAMVGTKPLPFDGALRALGVQSPGLALLGLAVIGFALASTVLGAVNARSERGAPYLTRVWREPATQASLITLSGFVGTALLFALDAAMRLGQ